MGVELGRGQIEQVSGQIPQRFQLPACDIVAVVLFETENKEPAVSPVGGHQSPRAAALAPSRQRYPLFQNATAQISVDKAVLHFPDSLAQRLIL
jgi:hypothetical protein